MRYTIFGALALSLLFSFITLGQTSSSLPQQPSGGYLVGPGDELTGRVLGEERFDFIATVDEDGRIEVPFFDKPVMVKCQSERQIRSEVEKLLKRFLKNPQLSVRVTKRNSRPPVSVYGEVRQQAQFDLTRPVFLLEVLSQAGGVTEKNGGIVQVFRTRPPLCGPANEQDAWKTDGTGLDVPSRMYSLAAVRQGREEANPQIFPGDIVLVPKASPVYVLGEVVRPGELDIPEGGLPLTQAIAMASGITREAKTKDVKIYRRKPGNPQPEIHKVNFDRIKRGEMKDPMLEPYDIVEVDKAKKSIGDILMEVVTGLPNRIPIPIRPI